MVLVGYGMLSRAYKYEWNNAPILLLAFFMLLTGMGNSAGNNAAINVQAKSWDGSRRGTCMAVVLSAFGLSALVYSMISNLFFTGNVTGYLDMLALGSFASFIVGLFLLKIIPPHPEKVPRAQRQYGAIPANGPGRDHAEVPRPRQRRSRSSSEMSARVYAWLDDMQERAANDDNVDDPFDEEAAHHAHATAMQLLKDPDFLLLWAVLGLISGAGLLLINNVGTITHALWDADHRVPTHGLASWLFADVGTRSQKEAERFMIQRIQTLQVSCISIGNASGRILIGALSDLVIRITGEPTHRTLFLLPVAFLAITSQCLAAWPNMVTDVHRLVYVSSLTGLMYGTLFGIGPVLVFEWFGMASFSRNWGLMSLSPVLGGNVYNLVFGHVYDSHVAPGSHSHRCYEGEDCYRAVFILTTLGCTLALLISITLVVRRVKGVRGWIARWEQRMGL